MPNDKLTRKEARYLAKQIVSACGHQPFNRFGYGTVIDTLRDLAPADIATIQSFTVIAIQRKKDRKTN